MTSGTREVMPEASCPPASVDGGHRAEVSVSEESAGRGAGSAAHQLSPLLPGKPRLAQLLQLHPRPNQGPPRPSRRAAQGASAQVHLPGGRPVGSGSCPWGERWLRCVHIVPRVVPVPAWRKHGATRRQPGERGLPPGHAPQP